MSGHLTLILGPVQSGKTRAMAALVDRCCSYVELYKPPVDTRGETDEITLHNGWKLEATVGMPGPEADDLDAIGIDELQFFGVEIVDRVKDLLELGVDVVACGLDMDSDGKLWGTSAKMLDFALELRHGATVMRASIGCECGAPATHSFRLSDGENRVLIGGREAFRPMCQTCWLISLQQVSSRG